MIYEMRTYYCAPGRLPALLNRFETITLDFWKTHGIRQVGFWTTMVGSTNQTLTYLLEWDSLAERDQRWEAFQADPAWIAARNATEAQATIVQRIENQLLRPTAFSKLR